MFKNRQKQEEPKAEEVAKFQEKKVSVPNEPSQQELEQFDKKYLSRLEKYKDKEILNPEKQVEVILNQNCDLFVSVDC